MPSRISKRCLPNVSRSSTACAALLIACAAAARADTYYWTGQGSTNLFSQIDQRTSSGFNYLPLVDLWAPDGTGLIQNLRSNLFKPTQPGGVQGFYAPLPVAQEFNDDPIHDLIFTDSFHANRTATLDQQIQAQSVQFTTHGNATLTDGDSQRSLSADNWLVRWPSCSGTLTFETLVAARNMWLGGTGEVVFRGFVTGFGNIVPKSGGATLVLDPNDPFVNDGMVSAQLAIRSGALIVKGLGTGPIFSSNLRVGTEFGGQNTLPTEIPYPGWEPIDLNPPQPAPAVYVRQTGVMGAARQVILGQSGSVVFDAPLSINFAGNIVSHAPGNGLVVKGGGTSTLTTLGDNVLNSYTGDIRIDAGTLRTKTPNPQSSVVFNSAGGSNDAVLELSVASGTQSFDNQYSGLGRIAKSGNGTVNMSMPAPAFTGDYRVLAGTLATSSNPGQSVLRNSVSVQSGTLLNRASENIDDAATITLNGGTWNLGGYTETVSGLLFNGNASAVLGGGTLRLAGNLVAIPAGAGTDRVDGPGTLFFTGASARTINVSSSSTNVGLDISAAISGAPVIVTGTGVVQFSGAFNSPSLAVQSGTARLNIPASANKPPSITVGYQDSFNPTAPVKLQLGTFDQIPDSLTLALVDHADIDFNGFSDQIGGLSVTGSGVFNITTSDGTNPGELGLGGNVTCAGGTTTFNGAMNLLAQTRTFQLNSGASLSMAGLLYSGRFSKTGPGTLRLDNLESFITVELLGSNNSVGVAALAGLTGVVGLSIDNSLTLNPIATVSTGFGGALSGAGSLIKTGAGVFELNGGATNSYTGGTRVEGGTLFLNRFPGTTAIPGNTTVASGGTLLFAGGASNEIADTADVTVESGGTVNMAGQTETVRNAVVSGTWNIDNVSGAAGNLAATQSILVAGGSLTGTVTGGPLTISTGTARVRGTVPSATVNLLSTLSVGGFTGSDQLTINGGFNLGSNTSTLKFTTGVEADPALIRALGALSYPFIGSVVVKVDQFVPQRVGTALKLIDFGNGSSSPQLSRYALAAPTSGSGRGVLTLNNRILSYVVSRNPCPADYDGSGNANVQDVFDFLAAWFAGTPGSDFDLSGQSTVQDVFDFLAAWFASCS